MTPNSFSSTNLRHKDTLGMNFTVRTIATGWQRFQSLILPRPSVEATLKRDQQRPRRIQVVDKFVIVGTRMIYHVHRPDF